MSEAENEIYPNGCLNTGTSHGIAGVGSVLAYAYKKGFMKKEILHGLERIIQIYEKFELVDKNKFHWKDGIDYNELVNNRTILKDNDLFIKHLFLDYRNTMRLL